MILFTILAIILILLVLFIVGVLSVGGATLTILFSDVIVCIVFIVLIMKWLIKRKRK